MTKVHSFYRFIHPLSSMLVCFLYISNVQSHSAFSPKSTSSLTHNLANILVSTDPEPHRLLESKICKIQNG